MAEPNKREKYAYLDQLSTQRLRELLRADLESDGTEDNSEVIFHILEVMERREREDPTGQLADVHQAREEFDAYYNIPEGDGLALYPTHTETDETSDPIEREGPAVGSRPHRPRRAVRVCITVAATIALLFTLLVGAQASGIDVFGILANWTDSVFSFGPIPTDSSSQAEPDGLETVTQVSSRTEIPEEYQELYAALQERGVSDVTVPTDIPDGFQIENSELHTLLDVQVIYFTALYGNGLDYITFDFVWKDNTPSLLFEKDEKNVELYTYKGIEYYIFTNNSQNVATWYANECEYSLSTTLSVENLKEIINSVMNFGSDLY